MTESVEWERLTELTRLPDVEKQLAETSADGAQWQSRAETAERELAELRERIAAELERISDKCGARAEDYADERSPGLEAAESAYWDAARRIRSGEIGRVVENGSEEAGDRG